MTEKKTKETKKQDVKPQEKASGKTAAGAPDCDCQGNTKKIYDVT
jgi:hypothetical protein